MSRKKLLNLILKITLSSAALYYVFSNINLAKTWEKITSADYAWLLIALIFFIGSQIVASRRLLSLFKLLPLNITFIQNLRLYWLGLFYNLFLPGGVGGDGFKVYLIHKHENNNLRQTIGAILSDRVSGLAIIVMMLAVLVAFIEIQIPLRQWLWITVPLIALGYYLFLCFFNEKLKPGFIKTLLWSLLSQSLQMIAAVMILKSLGVNNSSGYDDYLFLFFLSAIAGSVPITLGGIGAREMVFMWGATQLGVNANTAVTLSLLFYVTSAITALPGIIYTIHPANILSSQ
ncbi:lysylphosphatidylglycerol synthase transmembrane domain-containing protein [Geofilum sp. OHC36d9]|uniref:lysylphosphatidylglycerol synthase transmembrane domain-containing protein n=1 Tax=Geofilum sp. OHC36d9 TaxID=3458413 RepID=UPI004033802F